MITRFLSTELARNAQPQPARKLGLAQPRNVRPFPARKPVAAALAAGLLFAAALPVAQDAGAQVEPAREEIAPAPGPGFDYVDIPGIAPAPVDEHATIVPAVPSSSSDIQLAPGSVQPRR